MDGFYSNTLIPFVDSLVEHYAVKQYGQLCLTLDALPDHEINKFVAHMLEWDKDDMTALTEELQTSHLKQLMVRYETDAALDFAEVARNNIRKFYWKHMSEILNDRLQTLEMEKAA